MYVLFYETFEKSENMLSLHNSNIGTVDHRQGLKVNNNLELIKKHFVTLVLSALLNLCIKYEKEKLL